MPSPVYLIYGEDEYLVSAKAKEIISSLVPPENVTLGLETIDGNANTVDEAIAALNKCDEALRTMGFFGTPRVVWLRDVNFLTDNRVGKSERTKSSVNDLSAMIKGGLSPDTTLVLTASGIDKRYAFYKACKNVAEIFEFSVSDKPWQNEKEARERVREILTRAGLKMPQELLNSFIEKVGTDTRQMVNETEKLAVFLGDRKDVTPDDIEAITSSSRDALAWDLADAVGARDLRKALIVLRQLIFQKESHIRLIVSLEHRIRDLIIYREALDKGWLVTKKGYRGDEVSWVELPKEIEKSFSEHFARDPRKTHPYRAKLMAAQAMRFSGSELKRCHRSAMETHRSLVSSSVPSLMSLELLLIKILS